MAQEFGDVLFNNLPNMTRDQIYNWFGPTWNDHPDFNGRDRIEMGVRLATGMCQNLPEVLLDGLLEDYRIDIRNSYNLQLQMVPNLCPRQICLYIGYFIFYF